MKAISPKEILRIIQDIDKSPLSVNEYFSKKRCPIAYKTYYNYKRIIKEQGVDGLTDKRCQGNNLKFTHEIQNYVKGFIEAKGNVESLEIQAKIQETFQVTVSIRSINRYRQLNNLKNVPVMKEGVWDESGASELVIALALQSGFIDTISGCINKLIQNKKKTKRYKQSVGLKKDHLLQRSKGKFTSKYNQLREVRESRFKSIEEKTSTKKFDSMEIFKLSQECIRRYCIALLSLPIVTSNGRSRSVNNVKGNALKYLCGYNYKASTLDKHIRELKSLQISNELIEVVAKFWYDFWGKRNKEQGIFACYYIDGNTKALWSSKPCYKGKVTMLGRVMNCIEQLFIHDGQGHPIYFKTFNGHADLGKNGLEMMERITEYLQQESDLNNEFTANRILVMDGGGNAVKVLREIKGYYYITILDNNQPCARNLKFETEAKRYEYGEAYISDSKIELKDSKDGYIFETRAVQIKWDNGRRSTLVTNLPQKLFAVDNVVKSYFDRWPKEELDFKNMKNGVNLHRMVGYGKRLVENPNVIEKIEQLQKQIKKIEEELSAPLSDIRSLENSLPALIRKETACRERSKIVEGKRCFSNRAEEEHFIGIQRKISQVNNKIKERKRNHGNLFVRLKKKRDELARIIDKKKRYYVDVELDQLMTCFKMSFANICTYLIEECFDGKKMSLQKLFETILDLPGRVKEGETRRSIIINQNLKQVDAMNKLTKGFEVINKMCVTGTKGLIYNFKLV